MNKEPCEMSGPSRSLRVVSGTVARLALSALLAGCASRLSSIHRIARYQPEISVEEREPWERDLPETDDVAAEPVGEETAEPGNVAADPEPATGVDMSLARKLLPGDGIHCNLRNIPKPELIEYVIDDLGNINLPLIRTINIAGKTTAEAEAVITKAYVDGGFYKDITVIIVPVPKEYFMQGEVIGKGQKIFRGDMTLLMAIAAAGGYTDFANERKIIIMRGGERLRFNGRRIRERKDPDPLIKPDDIIVVKRRLLF